MYYNNCLCISLLKYCYDYYYTNNTSSVCTLPFSSCSYYCFLCSSSDYLDRVRNLPTEKCERARRLGHLEQRGVLRTNCIDCLDRYELAPPSSLYTLLFIYCIYTTCKFYHVLYCHNSLSLSR